MTGGAVYDYVKDFTTGQGYVTTDGANIDVDGSNSKWLSKLGTQAGTAAVSDANNHFVTGKDVYDATHVTNDGNYVKGNQFGCGQSCGDRQWAQLEDRQGQPHQCVGLQGRQSM